MTATDLINSALRLINVLASGELPSGAESNDALFVLNAMIDGWQTEKLLIEYVQRQVFVPALLKQTYTIGTPVGLPVGDFAVARPPRIDRAAVLNLGNAIQPLELPLEFLTDALWSQIPVKNISAALPTKLWYDNAFPYGNLNYWPIPNVLVNFVLYTWTALIQFPDLVTDITFPPGYQSLFRYNLAARLAIEFNRGIPAEVQQFADDAKKRVKSLNSLPIDARCDNALVNTSGGVFNYITGSSGRGGYR